MFLQKMNGPLEPVAQHAACAVLPHSGAEHEDIFSPSRVSFARIELVPWQMHVSFIHLELTSRPAAGHAVRISSALSEPAQNHGKGHGKQSQQCSRKNSSRRNERRGHKRQQAAHFQDRQKRYRSP